MTRHVTLVLTDVVDSTKLARAVGDHDNALLWDEHDRVARSLLARWDGQEVERTDGILALFDDPEAALAFARAYQEELTQLQPPLVTRVGMHAGAVRVRTNPDDHVARGAKPLEADGLALSLTARVASIAHGGQILSTSAALPKSGPPIRSHGHWRLKGVPDPVEIFEFRSDHPVAPPSDQEKAHRVVRDGDHWLPIREVPRALPAEWDPFVGRTEDLEALDGLFERTRLVTVTGIGGSGKTRLVTHYGWSRLGNHVGGVWFCDLAEARESNDITRVVAHTLGVPLGVDNHAETIAGAIEARGNCLIVLDNFEQVARHARGTLRPWLERADEARFLVTSQALLGLEGEAALSLPPLALDEAVELFATRAVAVHPQFRLDPEHRDDVRALVDLLDRLPLAIELAAARVRTMVPAELLERMSRRFELLVTPGGRAERHATLRRTLEWSWNLLARQEQSALAQLSVFERGFTLQAAESVLTIGEDWVPDVVQSLVDKSLVRRLPDGGRSRFRLLASVQNYAADQLDAMGDRDYAEARHGTFFAGLGTPEAIVALRTAGGLSQQRALTDELDNVVAACRRAAARGDGDIALPTLRAAWAVLDVRGPPALAAALADEVGEIEGLTPGLRDRLLAEAALARGSHVKGQRELRTSLVRLGRPEPRSLPGVIVRVLSSVLTQLIRRWGRVPAPQDDTEVVLSATRAYQRLVETYWFACEPPRMLAAALSALNLCEPLGPTPELARAYATLALATSGLRFDSVAERYAALALETAERSESPLAEAYVRFLACVYRIGHARFDEVDRDLEIAITLFEEAEDHRLLGDAITVQGMSWLYRGDFEAASPRFARVLTSGRRRSNVQHQVWGALGDAEAQLRLGEFGTASTRIGEALRVLETFESPIERARAKGLEASIALARDQRVVARDAAVEAVGRLRRLGPPTAHYLFEGYAGAAEVLVALGESSTRALKLMATFTSTFPIGEPRLAWLRARREQLRGRAAARQLAEEGAASAATLGMHYEGERLATLLGELESSCSKSRPPSLA